MRWIALLFALTLFAGSTAGAFVASTTGLGLPGVLDKPVSVRQGSVSGRRRSGSMLPFIYFGTRRHRGGGYGYGK
jgi:hypothetical protein